MASDTPAAETQPIQSSERGWQAALTSKNLSIVIVGAVLLAAIIKADAKDIPQLLQILFGSKVWATTGWIFAVVELIAAVVMIKLLTRHYDKEMNRLAQERDYLQSMLIKRSGE